MGTVPGRLRKTRRLQDRSSSFSEMTSRRQLLGTKVVYLVEALATQHSNLPFAHCWLGHLLLSRLSLVRITPLVPRGGKGR